jgi:hypothetical protein
MHMAGVGDAQGGGVGGCTCILCIPPGYAPGGGGMGFCWRPYSAGVLHSAFDQIQNLQNC